MENMENKENNRPWKQFVWFWVLCAKTVEYIRAPEPSHLI